MLEGVGKEDITLTPLGGKIKLWHQILGHIGERVLWELQGKFMDEGMYDYTLDFDFYEHCIYGK